MSTTEEATDLTGRIAGLQVGLPQTFCKEDKEWTSGIGKLPVEGKILLEALGFARDGQADLVNHGGMDKAVCVYSTEHYGYWHDTLKLPMERAAFGENVTATGLTEDLVWIGDIFALGEAVVQVSQPRQPCYKLALKHDQPELPLLVQQTGYTGYYFRVLQAGQVQAGDLITLLKRGAPEMSVAEANRIMYQEKKNPVAIERLLDVPALSGSWRATLNRRLNELR